jgi:hypothetical protein
VNKKTFIATIALTVVATVGSSIPAAAKPIPGTTDPLVGRAPVCVGDQIVSGHACALADAYTSGVAFRKAQAIVGGDAWAVRTARAGLLCR